MKVEPGQQPDRDKAHMACPDCPDGYVWNREGSTGATCKTCGGHAVLFLDDDDEDGQAEETP